MEVWQKEHIANNIYELVVHTHCNDAILTGMSKIGAISGYGMQQLSKKPDSEKAELLQTLLFYNMILKSVSKVTYSTLVKELETSEQVEAVKILRRAEDPGTSLANKDTTLVGACDDCTVDAIVEEMRHSPTAPLLQSAWTSLAMRLRIPSHYREALHQDLLSGRKSHVDVVADILRMWKNERKEQASLDELVEVFKKLRWSDMAVLINWKFGKAPTTSTATTADADNQGEEKVAEF